MDNYESLTNSDKQELVPNMLYKYYHQDLYIIGDIDIDYDDSMIVFKLQVFNDEGQEVNNQQDVVQIITYNKDIDSYPLGLDIAIKSMKLNEQAFFQVNESYVLSRRQINEQIEEFKTISSSKTFFWLIKIENTFTYPFSSSLYENTLEYIKKVKEYTGQVFQISCFKTAQILYSLIAQMQITEDQINLFKNEISKSYTNQAVCHLKMKDWYMVNEKCDLALQIDINNEKAFLLKGRAYFELSDYKQSLDYFKIYQFKNQTKNNEVQEYISKCNKNLEKNEQI